MIVAFLDASPSARGVLDAAVRLGEVAGARVGAVHVRTSPDSDRLAADLCRSRSVELQILDAPVAEALLGRLAESGVDAGVLGARSTAGGGRPVGSVTRAVIDRCAVPVMVVPPESVDPPPFRTALVPLEGTAPTSSPIQAWLPRFAEHLELLVLHVFTPDTVPRMLDRPVRDMAMIKETFTERHLPRAVDAEMRPGHVALCIIDCCRRGPADGGSGIDLVILSWLQPAGAGRAQTIMEVLSLSPLPTLLLPAATPGR